MKRVQRIARKWLMLRIDSRTNVSIRITIYFSSMIDIIQKIWIIALISVKYVFGLVRYYTEIIWI